MIQIEMGKLDLTEVDEANRVFAVQNQLRSIVNQINNSLMSIDASDVTISDGTTLEDLLSSNE